MREVANIRRHISKESVKGNRMTRDELIKARDDMYEAEQNGDPIVIAYMRNIQTILWALSQCIDPWNTNMDEAPKDGTKVLFWTGGYDVFAAYYVAEMNNSGHWVPIGGDITTKIYYEPTHWMPLPAPKENK
jgi:hypothetical protein